MPRLFTNWGNLVPHRVTHKLEPQSTGPKPRALFIKPQLLPIINTWLEFLFDSWDEEWSRSCSQVVAFIVCMGTQYWYTVLGVFRARFDMLCSDLLSTLSRLIQSCLEEASWSPMDVQRVSTYLHWRHKLCCWIICLMCVILYIATTCFSMLWFSGPKFTEIKLSLDCCLGGAVRRRNSGALCGKEGAECIRQCWD